MVGSMEGLNHCKLRVAIVRLWINVEGHSCFGLHSVIVGNNIIVGSRIFSIVKGLGFVVGLNHEFVKMLLIKIGLCQLHRLRRIVLVLG